MPAANKLSLAKLAANRANALKSTGPKSPEGKAASRLNGLTHGLCARIPLIPGEDPEERERRYGVRAAELKPMGEVELFHVEAAVDASFAVERGRRHEAAGIADRMEKAEADW